MRISADPAETWPEANGLDRLKRMRFVLLHVHVIVQDVSG